MSKLKTLALVLLVLVGISSTANAETVLLASDDFVGISFWIISMGMLAATAFFFLDCLEIISYSSWDNYWRCFC